MWAASGFKLQIRLQVFILGYMLIPALHIEILKILSIFHNIVFCLQASGNTLQSFFGGEKVKSVECL